MTEVLRAAFDLGLPDAAGKAVESTLGEVVPTEYRADLVIAFGDTRVIIEVQLSRDDGKRWTWSAYATTLRARERCVVYLLVATNSPDVARWAKEPIPLGNPGFSFAPLVLGPESCPRITDVEIALAHPELAVLTAILRSGAEPDHDNLLAALEGAVHVGGDQGKLYADLVLRAAGPLMQQVKEAFVATSHGYEFMSDFAKEQRIASAAESVIKVLAGRNLPVSAEEREIILATTDLTTIDRWLAQAGNVSSAAELLRAAPPSKQ